ncbi:hypothetical protein ACJ41O_014578 [Fusarium nematophilum]
MERARVNPVVPGFAPDPSIVYVDGTYFLVKSSFHIFPGLPVYASKDLREWRHIAGHGGSRVRAGLCYYKDEHRFVRSFLDVDSKEVVLEIVNRARSIERRTSRSLDALVGKGVKATFGVDYTELEFVFWFSVDGVATKEELGRIDSLDMTGHGVAGPLIGMYAVSDKEVKVWYSDFLMQDI